MKAPKFTSTERPPSWLLVSKKSLVCFERFCENQRHIDQRVYRRKKVDGSARERHRDPFIVDCIILYLLHLYCVCLVYRSLDRSLYAPEAHTIKYNGLYSNFLLVTTAATACTAANLRVISIALQNSRHDPISFARRAIFYSAVASPLPNIFRTEGSSARILFFVPKDTRNKCNPV